MAATPPGWLLDPERQLQINAVAMMGRAAPYTPDTVSDWRSNLTGDCQGKTEWSRDVLICMGWPENALEHWACDLPDGRRHAVLQVNIADVEGNVTPLIVDCRYPTPQVKDALPYSDWVRIE